MTLGELSGLPNGQMGVEELNGASIVDCEPLGELQVFKGLITIVFLHWFGVDTGQISSF